jgi:hypothetical protein
MAEANGKLVVGGDRFAEMIIELCTIRRGSQEQ